MPGSTPLPARWSIVLRALREASGATQAGWAAQLGTGRTTLQRWETGSSPPSADAEAALLRLCAERGLFRTYYQGPLRGVTVTAELVRDLLAEARLNGMRADVEGPRTTPGPARETTDTRAGVHLPVPRTSFVGRERDLVEVGRLLESNGLVTLSGPGGAGKTRLATHVAAGASARHADGVWMVDLSSIGDPTLVPRAAAATLGLREEPGETPLDTLVGALRDAQALLVLDNCEHVLLASAQLADRLLSSCRYLRLLATSRQPLGVAGETVWPIGGLDVPPPDAETWAPERLAASAAVQLFVERAAAVRPGFAVDHTNRSAVLGICRRLDGLPLAIELAAARTAVLAPAQIATRLDHHLRLLTTNSVSAAPRQQTLYATLDWSYDLLTAAEQRALRQLAVFAGGWTLESAEALLGDAAATFEHMSALVARSLVTASVGAQVARYNLLETVRHYAIEKLTQAGEAADARDRHLAWCLTLAEAAEPHLRGADQELWLERLQEELDNLRAALGWALAASDSPTTKGDEEKLFEPHERAQASLRLAAMLRWFWFTRGRPGEGRGWLERGLAVGGTVAPKVRARALDAAAALAHNQGDYTEALVLQQSALAVWQAEGEPRSVAAALSTLGIIAKAQGQHDVARTNLEDALGLARVVGEVTIEATVLNNLAALAMDVGDYARARALLDQSLAIKRRLGDAAGIATSLHNLGDAALHLGEYEAAIGFLAESLALFRRLAATDRIAQTLHSLGMVALRRGDVQSATAQLREGFLLFKEGGDGWGQALCMEGLAEAAAAAGSPGEAARLFGAAQAWREANRAPVPPNDVDDYERALATVRRALGATEFAIAWAAGHALGLELEPDTT